MQPPTTVQILLTLLALGAASLQGCGTQHPLRSSFLLRPLLTVAKQAEKNHFLLSHLFWSIHSRVYPFFHMWLLKYLKRIHYFPNCLHRIGLLRPILQTGRLEQETFLPVWEAGRVPVGSGSGWGPSSCFAHGWLLTRSSCGRKSSSLSPMCLLLGRH